MKRPRPIQYLTHLDREIAEKEALQGRTSEREAMQFETSGRRNAHLHVPLPGEKPAPKRRETHTGRNVVAGLVTTAVLGGAAFIGASKPTSDHQPNTVKIENTSRQAEGTVSAEGGSPVTTIVEPGDTLDSIAHDMYPTDPERANEARDQMLLARGGNSWLHPGDSVVVGTEPNHTAGQLPDRQP